MQVPEHTGAYNFETNCLDDARYGHTVANRNESDTRRNILHVSYNACAVVVVVIAGLVPGPAFDLSIRPPPPATTGVARRVAACHVDAAHPYQEINGT